MSRQSVETLVERWMEDSAFRAAVRQDPAAAIRATGLELTADEWAAVQNIDWSLSDEELSTRRNPSGSSASADGC
jgi:predicted ribosomally synthesized peptide with nif11-like leader